MNRKGAKAQRTGHPLPSCLCVEPSVGPARMPLGMGSTVHSLIPAPSRTPVGNLPLISRFVPVLKTRTFRLQTGTKPVQCSIIATLDCGFAWVGLKKGERHVAG